MEPLELNEEDNSSDSLQTDLKDFLKQVTPRLEHALQQNETMDIFKDDFQALVEEDILFGNKTDNYMKEFQSFTDFEFSKDKAISALDWRPDGKGIYTNYNYKYTCIYIL